MRGYCIPGHSDGRSVTSFRAWVRQIRLFGTTDNYNTEQSERLHIDFAKDAYRATNRKDIYSQMTAWLERHEKIMIHTMLINQRQYGHLQPQTRQIPEPPRVPTQAIKMALNPTKTASFDTLALDYGAVDFQDKLAEFLARLNNPGVSALTMGKQASNTLIPFRRVPVFHNIKFTRTGVSGESEISDTVHVRPEGAYSRKQIIPARFDTVVVRQDSLRSRGNQSKFSLYQNVTPN